VRVRRTTTLLAALLGAGALTPALGRALPALSSRAASALAPVRVRAQARAAATHGPSVSAALAALEHSGAIAPSDHRRYYEGYVAAKRALARLSGTRKAELGAVLANVQAMAGAGYFTPSRLPVVFLTLEANRRWWTTEAIPAADAHVSFPPSKIVWEYYPGQGVEIQWLATFGEANGYYLSGHENNNLRQLLGEVIPLATDRAGGIAWEYMFRFDGGTPPWTSGLSQGTALQALSRAYSRLREPAYLTAAQQALGIFQTAPPEGVRVNSSVGAMYAEYTYAPGDRILNGFIQALVGLYEYAALTHDPLGLTLFHAGDAEGRAILPHYDTGAWSMYDQYGESDLNYHELLTEFLQHLCERTRKGEPFTSAPAPTTPSTPPTSTTATGGQSARAAQASAQIPGDQIYCTTAQRFTADLHTPPVVSLLTTKLRGGSRAGVEISLSKVSEVRMTVRKGARVVWTNSAELERGKPKLLWVTPAGGGTFTVSFTATDLAGNFTTTGGTVTVTHH